MKLKATVGKLQVQGYGTIDKDTPKEVIDKILKDKPELAKHFDGKKASASG